tara:strand:- start:4125 stop:5762 length:1638 start_codon:yes stop_codon:yes gene_type:complete
MKTIIKIKKNKFWKIYSYQKSNFWVKGYFDSYSPLQVFKSLNEINISEIDTFIKSLKGHFAFVFKNEYFCIIVVDRVRSTPIFFSKLDQFIYISDHPDKLVGKQSFLKKINFNAINEILMSGYTVGRKTIYQNLNSLVSGEMALIKKNKIERIQYFKYFNKISKHNEKKLLSNLTKITINIFKKLILSLNGRQVVIPLSAGNDSRLVASILKFLNYKNVVCYSYGRKNSFEVLTASKVAKKLGFKWIFVPLYHRSEVAFYNSKEYKDYLRFSETYSSVPYVQSLSSIKFLKEKKIIDDNAIFINGNSGDFISGAHTNILKNSNYPNRGINDRKVKILNSLIDKHYSLWGILKTEKSLRYLRNELWSEIKEFFDKKNRDSDHKSFEYSEYINRQSKYVISGQRAYEFYGYIWRLPLWDDEYLLFWRTVPWRLKTNQKLFTKMLKHNNFGGVWTDDFQINKVNITPFWIIPLRFIFKIPFAFFGKKGISLWHQFEINFFNYWMDTTFMYKSASYSRIIKDIFKKPKNHVSWQAEDYIKYVKNESSIS